LDRLLQARALGEVPAAPRAVLEGHEGGRGGQEVRGPRPGPEAPRRDRRDRKDLLGDEGRLIQAIEAKGCGGNRNLPLARSAKAKGGARSPALCLRDSRRGVPCLRWWYRLRGPIG